MSQGSTRFKLDSDTDGYSTDDSKRKREETSPETSFRKSKKTARTPVKSGESMSDFKEIKEMMTSLMQEVKEIRKENREYREDVLKLREQNERMEGEIKHLRKKVERLELIEDKLEKMDRNDRRDNIIISGLTLEGGNGRDMDRGLEQFIQQNLNVDVRVLEASKINDKMWVAKLESFQKKIEVLKNTHKLRNGTYRRVYINSDLTKEERIVQKKIRERAVRERREGKNVKVGYQRLTIDGERYSWSNQLQELVKENQDTAIKNGETKNETR